jgi:hypothetical protein
MLGTEPRLGMVDGHVVKVICQTCYSEHAYQRGQGGKKKTGPRTTLFDQVLAKVSSPEEDSTSVAPKKKTAEPARYTSPRKRKSPRSKS